MVHVQDVAFGTLNFGDTVKETLLDRVSATTTPYHSVPVILMKPVFELNLRRNAYVHRCMNK